MFKKKVITKISMSLWKLNVFSITFLSTFFKNPKGNKQVGRNTECENESR